MMNKIKAEICIAKICRFTVCTKLLNEIKFIIWNNVSHNNVSHPLNANAWPIMPANEWDCSVRAPPRTRHRRAGWPLPLLSRVVRDCSPKWMVNSI